MASTRNWRHATRTGQPSPGTSFMQRSTGTIELKHTSRQVFLRLNQANIPNLHGDPVGTPVDQRQGRSAGNKVHLTARRPALRLAGRNRRHPSGQPVLHDTAASTREAGLPDATHRLFRTDD